MSTAVSLGRRKQMMDYIETIKYDRPYRKATPIDAGVKAAFVKTVIGAHHFDILNAYIPSTVVLGERYGSRSVSLVDYLFSKYYKVEETNSEPPSVASISELKRKVQAAETEGDIQSILHIIEQDQQAWDKWLSDRQDVTVSLRDEPLNESEDD